MRREYNFPKGSGRRNPYAGRIKAAKREALQELMEVFLVLHREAPIMIEAGKEVPNPRSGLSFDPPIEADIEDLMSHFRDYMIVKAGPTK